MTSSEPRGRVDGCPLCGGPSRHRFAKHGFWIGDCERCGHRFAEGAVTEDHVARVYGDAYFLGGLAGYPDYLGEGPALRERGRWYGRLLARFMPPGTALDVGCAAGFWLQGLMDTGWTGRGLEPNAAMAEHARKVLGLAVDKGTLEDLATEARFDLVGLIQVVAHFADVRRALAAAVGAIRPGGHLLVETWNRESWTARCLGRHWHEYSPPSVLHWFSPDGLRRLLEPFGLFEIARGRPRKRISGEHAKSLVRYKVGAAPHGRLLARALSVIPDRLSIPYPADDLFWMLLRKPDGTASGRTLAAGAPRHRRRQRHLCGVASRAGNVIAVTKV